jgi:hypothetical protein
VIQTIYDIVKAHGGVLKMETNHGVGTGFMAELPLQKIRNQEKPGCFFIAFLFNTIIIRDKIIFIGKTNGPGFLTI